MPNQSTSHRPSRSHIRGEERDFYGHGIGKKWGLMVKLVIARSIRRWYFIVFCALVLWFFRNYSAKCHITNKKLTELEAEVQYIREGNIPGDTSKTLNIMNEKLIELGNQVRRIQETENLHPVLNELRMTEKKVVDLETQVQYLQAVHNSWISAISTVPDNIGSWNDKTTLQVPGQIAQLSQTPEPEFHDSTQDIIKDTMMKIGRALQMIEHFKTVAQDALKTCTKDKDGRRDFAFLQTGGSVIASLTSKSISLNSSLPDHLKSPRSWRTLFDSLMSGRPSVTLPDIVLIGNGSIGACWAFSGSKGQIGIALSDPINISGVTVEHIGKELAEDSINVAPKDFELWGLVEGKDRHSEFFLFSGFYDTSKPSVSQTFEFTPTKEVYKKVIFKINSNHGNQHYTCIYRVRIHGVV
ncbi:uncharacterized protein MELLADRAFT_96428 [Melampsora larici-populina 98AG31]|uniref:SUN domain-containing protein n=1 Tax=Melampsora larici-populina (strain 98AG31 / pathotype 3-4-7) TaxID=747676 RepID=F4RET1_MELLP|nr:uncharacterized protein MELLADRAFT_96428 [Melampsora larici-populina 98AG31]EGG09154.1 hypothetical protein MELLADRAFT_96428 [Melampsora larici-populina 98AG31]